MNRIRRLMIYSLSVWLLCAAGPVARSDAVDEEIQSAMIQESYASFVDARAAEQLKAEGHLPLAELLERMSRRNRARFEDHSHLLPADSVEDRLTQVLGAAVAQEIQYGEAAVRSRAEDDPAMAAHFDKLAGEARYDRHLFQIELERAFGARQSL